MICCLVCGVIPHGAMKKTCREEMTAWAVDTKHLIGDDEHIWTDQPAPRQKFYGRGVTETGDDLQRILAGGGEYENIRADFKMGYEV